MSIRRCFHLLSLFILSFITILTLQMRLVANPHDFSLAQFYYQQGEYQKAIVILKEYQQKDIPGIHEYLGAAYEQTGKLSLALSHWQRAFKLYQQQGDIANAAEVLLSQAQVYLELGQPQKAIALIQQSEIPLPTKSLGVLGNGYFLAGEYERAVESYEEVLKTSISAQEELAALNNLTNAYQKLAARYHQRAELTQQAGEEAESEQWQEKAERAEESAKNTAFQAWQLGQDSCSVNRKLSVEVAGKLGRGLINPVRAGGVLSPYGSREKLLSTLSDGPEYLSGKAMLPKIDEKVGQWLSDGPEYLSGKAMLPKIDEKVGQWLSDAPEYLSGKAMLPKIGEKVGQWLWDDPEHLNHETYVEKRQNFLTEQYCSLTPNAIKAQLNWLPYLEESERSPYLETISSRLEALPPSHSLGNLWLSLAQISPHPEYPLKQALQVAQEIDDDLTLSLAAGELGQFYESHGNYDLALSYTEQAQQAAYPLLAYHSLFRWQWQEGRIYKALGKPKAAKSAYRRSVESLQRIRHEMAAAGKDAQFDFQEEVEPIYRGLLSLLLENPSPDELAESLQVFDLFQLAQLENLFGDACFETAPPDINQWLSEQNAALLVPIILEHQLHIVVRLPDGSYRHHARAIDSQELSDKIEQWRLQLRQVTETEYLNFSSFFYQLLFAPFSEAIEEANPDSLIFIGDGLLRNVPMAALYDSESSQFLVEKYPVAVALGQNFLQPEVSEPVNSLAFGLGIARPPLKVPLPMVVKEIESVQSLLGGEQFLDQQFTVEQLRSRLLKANPTVLHLATHGQFTGSVETSFIQAYDFPVRLNELERILLDSGRALDLLTLSACETSAGNNRAVLGLAGIAVRAGAKSVLGTLWSINDEVTLRVISDFYENWKSGLSKAEALQLAQIKQIKNYAHPRSWSPFVLIGI